jgi:hypothetical protein
MDTLKTLWTTCKGWFFKAWKTTPITMANTVTFVASSAMCMIFGGPTLELIVLISQFAVIAATIGNIFVTLPMYLMGRVGTVEEWALSVGVTLSFFAATFGYPMYLIVTLVPHIFVMYFGALAISFGALALLVKAIGGAK